MVLRYGQLYGPGTYHEQRQPDGPQIAIDHAVERTVRALQKPSGIVDITD